MNKREWMVDVIKQKYGFEARRVFDAMLQVPRERFVSKEHYDEAYDDKPIPIGYGQTVSQPLTVAFMTDLLGLKGNEKVLEIGTGSGYQTAVLSLLCRDVYSVEIIPELAGEARKNLGHFEFSNVHVKQADGTTGWKDYAPYDAVLVTADIKSEVPQALFDQLRDGGVLVAPVGGAMIKFVKEKGDISKEEHGYFSFVPFVEEG